MGQRKGWAETESRSDDEARLRNKGKPGRSMAQRKGQAETKSRSDDEVQSDDEDQVYTVGRGKLGSKGQGQRKGWAETESRLDDEDQIFTVGRGKLGKSKGQRKGGETESGSDQEAWPRKKGVKDPKCNDTENDSWDLDHRPIKERS